MEQNKPLEEVFLRAVNKWVSAKIKVFPSLLLAWGSSSGGRCCHLMVAESETIVGQNSDGSEVKPAAALCRPLLPALRTVTSMFLSSALRVVGVNLVSLSARKPSWLQTVSSSRRRPPGSITTLQFDSTLLLFSLWWDPSSASVLRFMFLFPCVNAKTTVNTWFSNIVFYLVLLCVAGLSHLKGLCLQFKCEQIKKKKSDRIDPETLESFLGSYVFFELVLYCFLMWQVFYYDIFFLKNYILMSFSIFSINGLLCHLNKDACFVVCS